MAPLLGDDVADLLEAPHDEELRRWQWGTGHTLRYAGWQASGNTIARLIAAYGGSGTDQKLIVKYVPLGYKETDESARHTQAWNDAPDGFRRHLVEQPWQPIMLSRGGWLLFQQIAARDLTKVRPMSTMLGDAAAAGAAAAVVSSALGKWNPKGGDPVVTATGEHLSALMGKRRLRPGHPLCDWAYARDLLTGAEPRPTTTGVGGLPNPFALVLDAHDAYRWRLYTRRGRAHGDLHPGNILLGADTADFWLIDLSRFTKDAPLTFDPAYFLLTTIAYFLPQLGNNDRHAAVELLLAPSENDNSPLPCRELITSIHAAGETWADRDGLAQEWRRELLLSFVAAGLIMCGRAAISETDREWFLHVSAAAAERYIALGEPANPGPRDVPGGAPRPRAGGPRIVATDRASLRARTLPTVTRARLLDLAFARRRKQSLSSGKNQVLVLTGEGGIGKSVLLGQLLERVEAEGEQAAVLVACGNVGSGSALTDLATVDQALGVAADQNRGRGGLLRLLTAQRATHDSVMVLVDTLDLLLSGESAAALAELVQAAADIGDVVVTCRTHEFNAYLQAVPRLAGRLTTYPVPALQETEIIAWAKRYLETEKSQRDHSSFIASLAGGISSSGSLREVCALPVRLALACETFANEGHLPEDLSVTGLYQAYWDVRVRRQGGQASTAAGDAKELAALQVARHVITRSGRIALRVPKAAVDHRHKTGLKLLASEGVVRELSTEWEFFHQTFAEFGHARWVLTHGVESDEFDQLVTRTTTGHTNLWPVVSSVLLQITGYDDYRIAAEMVPVTSADAARTQVLGALQRHEADALSRVLTDLAHRVELVPVALAALGNAPARHVPVAFAGALDALREHPVKLGSAAVDALASLVPRAATGAEQVRDATLAVAALRGAVPESTRDGYLERLVRPLAVQPATEAKRAVVREVYPRLGPLGRRAAVRAHFHHAPAAECVAIARIAIQVPCPPLDDDELVTLMRVLWTSHDERDRLGWTGWRELLADTLPKDWDNAQLKLVVRLAEQDEELADELVDELLRGQVRSPERHVNAFAQIVAERVDWAANQLLARAVPAAPLALNAISKCGPVFAANLDQETRTRLIDWLRPARQTAPRSAWPTQFTLAAGDLDTHRALLAELWVDKPVSAVLVGVAQSLFYHAPLRVLEAFASELRALVEQIQQMGKVSASETLRIRARLEGRLAENDRHAREWIDQQIGRGASPAVAGTVVKTIADTHPDGLPASMVSWLGTLLHTPHTDAAERLTTMLNSAAESHDGILVTAAEQLTTAIIDRMQIAADNREDSRLPRALLNLLIRIDVVQGLSEESVREIYDVTRVRLLPRDSASDIVVSDCAAALRDLSTLSGTLMARRLTAGTVRELVGQILLAFDSVRLGRRIRTALDSLLISMTRRDPDAPEWLTAMFGVAGVALEVRMAIAEALLQLEGDMPGGRAEALKDRPACPPEVAALIVTRLRA